MTAIRKPKRGLTKQERAYGEIRERILSGAYGPGSRIIIDTLAAEFGISPLPVREAIRRLEAEGLVFFRPNAGPQVALAEPEVFAEKLTVLAILEGYATALAAPHVGPDEIRQLSEATAAMDQAIERIDPFTFGTRNHEFHEVIYGCCPNASLVELLTDLARRLDVIRRTVFLRVPYRGAESVAEHRHLIVLLAKGAPFSEIESAARDHKLNTVRSFHLWLHEAQD